MTQTAPRFGVLGWPLVVGVACFVSAIVVGVIAGRLLPGSASHERRIMEMVHHNPLVFMVTLVLVAPLLETLIGQWLPIALTGLMTDSVPIKVVASSVVFGALHLGNSLANAAVILLAVGPIFAYTFVRWRRVSRTKAYVVTAMTHGVHNFCGGALLLLGS